MSIYPLSFAKEAALKNFSEIVLINGSWCLSG